MAVNKRDLNTITGETGWPVVNYAQEERNMQTSHNGRAGALSIPRFKFTFLVEFQFSPRALDNPITNLKEFVSDTGKLYTHLVSIDHPSPTFKVEKKRSYNKWINIPTQVEYPSASMMFHDDSTSVVQALWKEHLNFYTYQATIGDTISGVQVQSNLGSSQEVNSFQFTDDLVAQGGGEMRSAMGRRPSLGMRLKPNDGRHFLESIVIYDLGTEPDAINVYWYHRPMITAWNHDALDKEDRTGNVRVNASFDYEGYYFTIGQNRGRLADYIQHILGAFPEGGLSTPRKAGIARDGLEELVNRPVELTEGIIAPSAIRSARQQAAEDALQANEFANVVTEPALESELNPIIPNSLAGKQRDLDQIQAEKDAIKEGRIPLNDPEARLAELDERAAVLTEDIKTQKAEQRAGEFVSAQEQSALINTSEAAGLDRHPPINTTKVPNPVNQQKSDSLGTASVRASNLSVSLGALARSQSGSAQVQANLGNVSLANFFQEESNANAADAEEAQDTADALEAESKRIDPNTER